MKKIVACLLVLALCLSASVTVLADTEFVPSISFKPAPGVSATEPAGHEDCIFVIPVAEADTAEELTKEEAETLKKVYAELSEEGAKLSEECADLTPLVQKVLGENRTADDLVVRDLFHVGASCEDIPKYLADGGILKVTLDTTIADDEKVFAMVFKGGKWVPLADTLNKGEGAITIALDELGPVALMVPASGGSDDTQTGENTDTILWVSVMLVAMAAMVVLVVLYRRRSNAQ